MIEIDNKTTQVVYFPKTMKSTGPYTLKIHSELSQKDWRFDNLLDQANLNDYYKFTVDFTEVDDGEFNYSVSKDDDVFDTGLIRIGIGQASVRGYDTPNEIIQYDMYGAPTERYQHKSISATSNGTYNVLPDEDYVALSEVDIYVNVPSDSGASYESGYTEGYASGYTEGSEDGYGSGYTSGKTDGIAEQKAKLVATSFTENRTYTRADGWNSVSVNVPQTGHTDEELQQAYASGQTYQKSLLVSTAVTSNGTYSRPDGYSSISVNVAQTGHTDQELLDAFNSGYTNGKAEGYNSGWTNGYNSGKTDGYDSGWTNGYNSGWTDGYISGYTDGSGQTPSTAATALTISVPSSITGTGKVNVTAEPSTAVLDLVYTSSDNTIATVDSNGNITVLSAGTVNICATDSISGLYDCDTVTVEPYSGLNIPFTVEVISAGTILWVANANATPLSIEYQKNNGEWTSITSSTAGTQISVVEGDVVRFRGNNLTYSPNNTSPDNIPKYSNHFLMQTGKYALRGNIMSLIDSTNFANLTTLSSSCTFYGLFNTSNGLVDASQLLLPATNLHYYCYQNMFADCSYLEAAPAILPATTLSAACYYNMFAGCTRLTTAPKLPATTLAGECYAGMFAGCTSLTTAPELPATTLAYECYEGMFSGCTSLTVVPDLSATTLANNCCDRMFQGCTSLTTAPALPATTLADECYNNMFYKCTSLTTPPALPAETLAQGCYSYMFRGCTSLTTAPALPATTLATECYFHMFDGCTSLTTVQSALPATTLAQNCYGNMFYGCTSLTTAPELPGTTLAASCYNAMFRGCTSLTTAPELPAPILAYDSYAYMFNGCSSLNYIKCLAIDKSAIACTTVWVAGVSSTGTFVKDPNISESTWTRGVSGIPTGWTVVDAQ